MISVTTDAPDLRKQLMHQLNLVMINDVITDSMKYFRSLQVASRWKEFIV